MLRNPRLWLYAAGGWLLLSGVAQLGVHVWSFVLENGMIGRREFAMEAMKQALGPDPLLPSMWQLFRTFSASFGLLLVFAGVIDVILAWTAPPPRVIKAVAIAGTLFWTVAFVPYAFLDPVLRTLLIAIVAVPLHAVVFLTAALEEEAVRS